MAARPGNDDDTIRIRPAGARPIWPGIVAAAALVIALSVGAWTLLRPAPVVLATVSPAPQAAPSPPVATAVPAVPVPVAAAMPVVPAAPPSPPPAPDLKLADESEILASHADHLVVFRFAPAPAILVMVFASLHRQGEMLNRVGAFVEKSGLPRDRVLSDAALTQAIDATHDTPDTYYYGDDYQAADLARFFATARADGIVLNAFEERFRGLLQRQGLLEPGAVGAVISLTNASDRVDERARATILRHELSHGLFFTNPAYAEYSQRFWDRMLSPRERAHFIRFLGGQGYDTGNEQLMLNETQAYLVHTADSRFFNARAVDLPQSDVDRLRAAFVRDMPPSWLRDRTQP